MSHHHRSVLTAGAAESDGEIVLTFTHVMGQQEIQQVANAQHEFLRLRKIPDVFGYFRIFAGQRLEVRDVIWIGQKPDVKHKVCVPRYTISEAEAHDTDQQLHGFITGIPELRTDQVAKLVDG